MHSRAVPYGGAPWKGGSNYVKDAPSRALAVQSEAQVRCQLAEGSQRRALGHAGSEGTRSGRAGQPALAVLDDPSGFACLHCVLRVRVLCARCGLCLEYGFRATAVLCVPYVSLLRSIRACTYWSVLLKEPDGS